MRAPEFVQALPGFEFHVLDADPRRIKRVRIARKRPAVRRRHAKLDGDIPHLVPEPSAALDAEARQDDKAASG